MSEEKDKVDKSKGKQLSRREFLKDAGLVAGGAAVGSMAILSACGEATTKTITQTQTQTVNLTVTKAAETTTLPQVTTTVIKQVSLTQSTKYLVVDPKKCSGCRSCMLACSTVHEGKADLSKARIQIVKDTFGSFPTNISQNVCFQCSDPQCYEACPQKGVALVINATTGVRLVDESKCNGCGLCILACPFEPSRITMDMVKKVALKCDMCQVTPYWDNQGKQACVEICPVKAIDVVTYKPISYETNLRGEGWKALGLPID